jgi:hypothetical protein
MEKARVLKTEFKREREKRDLAIYKEYHKMAAVSGQSKMPIIRHLMEKFNIHSPNTIYVILRRVEEA